MDDVILILMRPQGVSRTTLALRRGRERNLTLTNTNNVPALKLGPCGDRNMHNSNISFSDSGSDRDVE